MSIKKYFPHSNGFTTEKRRILMHISTKRSDFSFTCRLTTAVESYYTIRIHREAQENCVELFPAFALLELSPKNNFSDKKEKRRRSKKAFLTDREERKRKKGDFLRKFRCIEGLVRRCIKAATSDFTTIILLKKSASEKSDFGCP